MLNSENITIGRLKQAYRLSEHDADSLVNALLPDKVFPYAIWKKVYEEFWEWAVHAAASRYKVESPLFPDAGALPNKFFPVSLHRTLLVRFFGELSKIIPVSELEKGIDYIIEATYGEENFPFAEQKKSLFRALREEERSHENWERTSGPMVIMSMQSVDYFCITESYYDTIVVDKAAAIRYFSSCGYPLRQEVKGVTRSLVKSIINSPEQKVGAASETKELFAESAADTLPSDQMPVIRIPASLWEGKSAATVRDAMKAEYRLSVIAYVLFNWCGVSKTQVGRLLSEKEYEESKSYRNFADGLLKEAASYTIIKA